MDKNLISDFDLTSKRLIYERLAGSGLISPRAGSSLPSSVWILGTSVLPQPANISGVWDDAGLFVDANVWYD